MIRPTIALFLLLSWMYAAMAQADVQPFLQQEFTEMPYVRDLAISNDGNELFFTVDDYKHTIGFIVTMTRDGSEWSKPEVVSFSGQYRDIEPFLSPDGKRLYFASNRPVETTSTEIKDYDLWYVERTSTGSKWSDPVWLGAPVNSGADEFYPSVTANGDLYFTAAREGSTGAEDIFVAKSVHGKYQDPVSLAGGVNSGAYEFNAFVAPDASYIIYTSYRERGGRNRSDLYISQKTDADEWGPAQLIPGIYSNSIEYCPFVDRQGSRLYFTSERNEMSPAYPEGLDLNNFLDLVRYNPNGLGRIYFVDFQEVLNSLPGIE